VTSNQGVAHSKKALFYNWHYGDAMYHLGSAYGEMLNFEMARYKKTTLIWFKYLAFTFC
jgi:hypothetical protein